MWKKALVFSLVGISFLSLLTPTSLQAYNFDIEDLLTSKTLDEIIDGLVDLLFRVSIVLVPLMIIITAFLLVTAGGDANKVAQAKRLISWTIIGFLVILLSKGILAIIKQLFGLG